jgi:hypothetical protein
VKGKAIHYMQHPRLVHWFFGATYMPDERREEAVPVPRNFPELLERYRAAKNSVDKRGGGRKGR